MSLAPLAATANWPDTIPETGSYEGYMTQVQDRSAFGVRKPLDGVSTLGVETFLSAPADQRFLMATYQRDMGRWEGLGWISQAQLEAAAGAGSSAVFQFKARGLWERKDWRIEWTSEVMHTHNTLFDRHDGRAGYRLVGDAPALTLKNIQPWAFAGVLINDQAKDQVTPFLAGRAQAETWFIEVGVNHREINASVAIRWP